VTARIRVDLPDAPYDVVVGDGLLGHIDDLDVLPDGAGRALVVTQEPVARHHLAPLRAALERARLEVDVATIADGEQAKTPTTLEVLWRHAAELPLGRHDLVVALGGGVVGDLAGFLAATYNRGIAVLQVPTTLLAQVDAAIGGKTGVNLPQGKNLVGAFHQPHAVVADVATLATLEERVLVEGLGEVVKAGLIRDQSILGTLEAHPAEVATGEPDVLADLVERSVAVKAAVVVADERETGERAHLNLGHTYGHAIETLTDYRFLHGEAVAIGTLVALELGARLGLHDRDLVDRVRRLLDRLGLPTVAPPLPRDDAWRVMSRDKKARDGVRFVVLEALGVPMLVTPDRTDVEAAIAAVEGGGAR
jgi:3-dehydroquinate synthase